MREWNGIDRHRMDKFYLLCRRILAASFKYLKQIGYDQDILEQFNSIMSGTKKELFAHKEMAPLAPGDVKSHGVRYHVISIYLDELQNGIMTEDMKDAPIRQLLKPIMDLYKDANVSQTLRKRIEEEVFESIIERVKGEHCSSHTLYAEHHIDYPISSMIDAYLELEKDPALNSLLQKHARRLAEMYSQALKYKAIQMKLENGEITASSDISEEYAAGVDEQKLVQNGAMPNGYKDSSDQSLGSDEDDHGDVSSMSEDDGDRNDV